MNSAFPVTISLIASGALHFLLFLGLVRSARGSEQAWEDPEPARFVGNTFEIETLDAATFAAANPAALAPASPPVPKASEPAPAPEPTTDEPSRAPEPVLPLATAPEPPAEPAPAVSQAPREIPPRSDAPQPSTADPRPASLAEAAATDEAGPAASSATPSGAAPSYGQDALPASTASFAKAFTRAVPRIASADRVWHGLPLGRAGSAVFSIEVDAHGKLMGQGTVLDEPAPAAHLERIIGRTVLLLRNQTFALAADGAAPASQRFELSAEIRQVAALEDNFAEPQDLRQIGRLVEPTRVRPGKANFTFNSGRQVELTVRLLTP